MVEDNLEFGGADVLTIFARKSIIFPPIGPGRGELDCSNDDDA